jgi:hypothetical protein
MFSNITKMKEHEKTLKTCNYILPCFKTIFGKKKKKKKALAFSTSKLEI